MHDILEGRGGQDSLTDVFVEKHQPKLRKPQPPVEKTLGRSTQNKVDTTEFQHLALTKICGCWCVLPTSQDRNVSRRACFQSSILLPLTGEKDFKILPVFEGNCLFPVGKQFRNIGTDLVCHLVGLRNKEKVFSKESTLSCRQIWICAVRRKLLRKSWS